MKILVIFWQEIPLNLEKVMLTFSSFNQYAHPCHLLQKMIGNSFFV